MKSRIAERSDLADLIGLSGAGCRLPYDETPGACPRCGAKIVIRLETDGNGHLVEQAGPCHVCGRGVHTPFGLPFKRVPVRHKIAPAPRRARQDARAEIRAALLRGVPATRAATEIGVTRGAVLAVRRALEAEGRELTCRCGKPAGHRGRCLGRWHAA